MGLISGLSTYLLCQLGQITCSLGASFVAIHTPITSSQHGDHRKPDTRQREVNHLSGHGLSPTSVLSPLPPTSSREMAMTTLWNMLYRQSCLWRTIQRCADTYPEQQDPRVREAWVPCWGDVQKDHASLKGATGTCEVSMGRWMQRLLEARKKLSPR